MKAYLRRVGDEMGHCIGELNLEDLRSETMEVKAHLQDVGVFNGEDTVRVVTSQVVCDEVSAYIEFIVDGGE